MQIPSASSLKRMLRRTPVRGLGLALLFFVSFAITRRLLSKTPPGSYPVLSTAHWAGRYYHDVDLPGYTWIGNGDLAYLKKNARGAPYLCYQKMDAKGPVGPERIGPELPRGPIIRACKPSPNEAWVAYIQNWKEGEYRTILVSADGKTTRLFPEWFEAWLPDGRGFLVSATDPDALKIYYLATQRTERLYGAARADTLAVISSIAAGDRFMTGSSYQHIGSFADMCYNYPRI